MKFNASRKYRLALLSLFLVTAGYGITHLSDRLKDSYMLFIGGVGTVLSLYGASNVGNKWVLGKSGALPAQQGSVITEVKSTPATTEIKQQVNTGTAENDDNG